VSTVTETTVELPARDLRAGDLLLARDSELRFRVYETRKDGAGKILVRAESELGQVTYHLPPERVSRVLDREPACDPTCHNGTYHGAGVIENGVFKGITGRCFRCSGKGWQSRADRLRNWWYDNRVRKF
jgi:hypothetical protein